MTTIRWGTGLVDAIQLIGLALTVPIAILLVGAPIAMAIAFVLWLVRAVGSGL